MWTPVPQPRSAAELAGVQVAVIRPVGGDVIDIATASGIVATVTAIRDHGHVIALETATIRSQHHTLAPPQGTHPVA